MNMAKTVQAPISAYIPHSRKAELERIVEATSKRMTISKLVDEAVEAQLPAFWKKYASSFPPPTQGRPHGKKRKAA